MKVAVLADCLLENKNFLKRESRQSDLNGRPTKAMMEFLTDVGIPFAMMPECYGGRNYDYTQEYTLIKTAASIAPSLGWVVFQLCGNPPRVLSFYDQENVETIIEKAGKNLIVAYDTNPYAGIAKRNSDHYEVSGTWAYATLSQVARYFAVPFLDPKSGAERCYLADVEQVEVDTTYHSDGLQGTSTTRFTIKGVIKIDEKSCPVANYNNKNFSQTYRLARAPVKHLAWAIGYWEGLLDIVQSQDNNANVRAIVERNIQSLKEIEAPILDKLASLKNTIETEGASAAESGMEKLKDISVQLQSWVLETTISLHLANPPQALDGRSEFYRWVRHGLTGSLHGAVREKSSSWTWGEQNSPRLNTLLKNLGS